MNYKQNLKEPLVKKSSDKDEDSVIDNIYKIFYKKVNFFFNRI